MNHFETYHKPQFSVKEYLLPFLAQYLILMVCIMLHRLFIGMVRCWARRFWWAMK